MLKSSGCSGEAIGFSDPLAAGMGGALELEDDEDDYAAGGGSSGGGGARPRHGGSGSDHVAQHHMCPPPTYTEEAARASAAALRQWSKSWLPLLCKVFLETDPEARNPVAGGCCDSPPPPPLLLPLAALVLCHCQHCSLPPLPPFTHTHALPFPSVGAPPHTHSALSPSPL